MPPSSKSFESLDLDIDVQLNQLLRAVEGDVDVAADVVGAQHRVEAGLVEHGLHRRVDT